ncbi:MAG: CYTH domain-containing protein [Victivallaceae bacterium]|nr:CYTH domain-containing protein [Victivallaceae bacterium]
MGCEIERKFLVADDSWRRDAASTMRIVQGYARVPDGGELSTVRVRIIDGIRAYLTIKGRHANFARSEFEYEIPLSDAADMLAEFCPGRMIVKNRSIVPAGELKWEVDEFLEGNCGLVVAEIEIPSPDSDFERPPWLGKEVTQDKRYGNGYLSRNPFTTWHAEDEDAQRQ